MARWVFQISEKFNDAPQVVLSVIRNDGVTIGQLARFFDSLGSLDENSELCLSTESGYLQLCAGRVGPHKRTLQLQLATRYDAPLSGTSGLRAEGEDWKTCAYVKYAFDVDVGRLSNALASLNALRREMDNLIE